MPAIARGPRELKLFCLAWKLAVQVLSEICTGRDGIWCRKSTTLARAWDAHGRGLAPSNSHPLSEVTSLRAVVERLQARRIPPPKRPLVCHETPKTRLDAFPSPERTYNPISSTVPLPRAMSNNALLRTGLLSLRDDPTLAADTDTGLYLAAGFYSTTAGANIPSHPRRFTRLQTDDHRSARVARLPPGKARGDDCGERGRKIFLGSEEEEDCRLPGSGLVSTLHKFTSHLQIACLEHSIGIDSFQYQGLEKIEGPGRTTAECLIGSGS
ncbi:hypothetical protein K438DRAFT_1759387 [Mycena galopus ATCC 62051]|nr:hypothetical protein K438DRAFT_1759387 [Mycena galopus ATCC 62051]